MSRQHNPDNGRKCWGTKREKERLRARYLIRDRVAVGCGDGGGGGGDRVTAEVDGLQELQLGDGDDENYDDSTLIAKYNKSITILSPNQIDIILKYIGYVKNGDKSKFSLSSMSNHVNELMTQILVSQVLYGDHLSHTIQLCLAWYGPNYATFINEYISSLTTVTIMEYAIWMGKYSILGNLLVGGINPCIRCQHSKKDLSKHDTVASQSQSQSQQQQQQQQDEDWNQRLQTIGMRVLQRFFNNFPILLSSYIVKCVVDMRMYAYYESYLTTNNRDKEEKNQEQVQACASQSTTNTTTCHSCKLCQKSYVPPDCILQFPSRSCNHIFCEVCFWDDILQNIDDRHELGNVVLCPICREPFDHYKLPLAIRRNDVNCNSNSNNTTTIEEEGGGGDSLETAESSSSSTTLTTLSNQRRIKSLDKYLALPKNRHVLKSKREKKKKLSEDQHIASSWFESVKSSLGNTQDVRKDKFFMHVDKGSIHYIRACLKLGVDINWINEYGQTSLYVTVWKGSQHSLDIVDLLLSYGADPNIAANGGSTIYDLLNLQHLSYDDDKRDTLINILDKYVETKSNEGEEFTTTNNLYRSTAMSSSSLSSRHHLLSCCTTYDDVPESLKFQTLIKLAECHPGAGSYIIDDTLSSNIIECLLLLRKIIPEDESSSKKKKNKGVPCSTRSYYCDSEGFICNLLTKIIESSGLVKTKCPTMTTTTTGPSVMVFPHMRFLHYGTEGTELAPHVDLCRVDSSTGIRSTHSFLLYLTDCEEGGETSLLGAMSGDGRNQVLATVSPKRGRLLLFPHACPHEGNRVVNVPKTLLRGEVTISRPGEA